MPNWKALITKMGHNVDTHFDRLKARLNERIGHQDPIQIIPYRGYGRADSLLVRGRVIEENKLQPATDNDTIWDNLLATYRRFESDEVPGVRVKAQFEQTTGLVTTDHEGYFDLLLNLAETIQSDQLWHDVQFELVDPVGDNQELVQAKGQVLIPPKDCEYGVISDIDDTVLQTNATNLLQVAQLTFLNNARTRLPFEGVAAFYQALQKGLNGQANNPIFYLSSSPWNLYDLLVDFFNLQQIPLGPLLLQDYGLDRGKLIHSSHYDHKHGQIIKLLEFYPHLSFILIGDSGQKDAEIYRQVAIDYPKRIKAIYIRDVTAKKRSTAVHTIADEVATHGIDLILAADSLTAAKHAAANGLIRPDELDHIQQKRDADAEAPNTIDQLLTE